MNINKILSISRPRFWLYILGPYIIGISATGDLNKLLKIDIWYCFFYFLIPANLFIYAINDYFDQSIDTHNPKKKLQETYMKLKEKKLYQKLILTSLLLSLPLFFLNPKISLAMATFLLVGAFYSSPPFRFKTKLFLDSISNFFYIIPGIIGYILITSNVPPYDILIAASLWTISMHLFSAIVDIDADKKAGIKTTATILGYKRGLLLTSLIWLISTILVLPYSPLFLIGITYPLLPLYVLFKKSQITNIYWMFPLINLILGFVLFCIVIYGL